MRGGPIPWRRHQIGYALAWLSKVRQGRHEGGRWQEGRHESSTMRRMDANVPHNTSTERPSDRGATSRTSLSMEVCVIVGWGVALLVSVETIYLDFVGICYYSQCESCERGKDHCILIEVYSSVLC